MHSPNLSHYPSLSQSILVYSVIQLSPSPSYSPVSQPQAPVIARTVSDHPFPSWICCSSSLSTSTHHHPLPFGLVAVHSFTSFGLASFARCGRFNDPLESLKASRFLGFPVAEGKSNGLEVSGSCRPGFCGHFSRFSYLLFSRRDGVPFTAAVPGLPAFR